ncbi:MAG: RNA 3'-terminal phosphate cyclase [Candidatus Aenigmarchaeota archaeon]|nr:RNA 3'-terminal phosphate cyclase [Candidatus Aenigmarchaeota archaeon]
MPRPMATQSVLVDMIAIDGSYGSGGGQIIRTAIGLSALTGKPCRITGIRAGRPNPGLQAQHLESIKAVAQLCNAKVDNLNIRSKEILFSPGNLEHKPLTIDIGTAGAITLVLQSLLIPAVHADKKLCFTIKGGTHVKWSPSYDFFENIFCRYLSIMGIEVKPEITGYGFYPRGGGSISVEVNPGKIRPICLTERGGYLETGLFSIASTDLKPQKVAERQSDSAGKVLSTARRAQKYVDSLSTGSSVHMDSHYENCILGAGCLGERGMQAEKVGESCALLLKKQADSGACLDEWMADQILPYMALATPSAVSVAAVTDHVRTNIWVIEKFLPVEFSIDENSTPKKISCRSKQK